MQAMPSQLVLGCDVILNTPIIVELEVIRQHKLKLMDKNNQLGNKNFKPHTYKIQYKVLVCDKKTNNYKDPYVCPYPITQVWTNINSTIRQGAVQELINIICIKPYHE